MNYLQSLGAKAVKEIADQLDSETARAALQGVLACAGAAAQSQSCGAGAAGAAASVVLNNLLTLAKGKTPESQTPQEKEAQLNLVTSLITGIATAAGADVVAANTAVPSAPTNAPCADEGPQTAPIQFRR